MAICELHFASESLRKQVAITAILPEGRGNPFPVLYLLHGLSDDNAGWTRLSSIERYVRDLPLMVVMHDGGRGWYTDAAGNPAAAYESLIVRDLIGFVDSTFRTIPSRDGRAICGHSMGGYGAIKLVLKHPQLFCAAIALSGAFDLRQVLDKVGEEWAAEFRIIFGETLRGGPEDVFILIGRVDPKTLPRLWLACGDEDYLIECNRRMHEQMADLGIEHEYHETTGGHSWDYWDRTIVDALAFLRDVLDIE